MRNDLPGRSCRPTGVGSIAQLVGIRLSPETGTSFIVCSLFVSCLGNIAETGGLDINRRAGQKLKKEGSMIRQSPRYNELAGVPFPIWVHVKS